MRELLKRIIPDLIIDYIRIKRKSNKEINQSVKEVFTDYKENQYWNSDESLSGDGSELSVTIDLRKGLKDIIESYNIKSILDIPCGDFNWMKEVDLKDLKYIGGEIVSSLVENNNEKYSSDNISFKELDIISDELPKVDLIFCRDCLVHLSYKQIYKALLNIKRSNSKYLLTTSFINSFENKDILTGEWRRLNLESRPFKFTPPLSVLDEKYLEKEKKYIDKSMCLWNIEDIKLPIPLKVYSWFI